MSFPPPPPGAERRVHRRQDLFATVELEWDQDVIVTAVLNVSLGGAFFELPSDHRVEAGETVQVQLTAGGLTACQPARVVRVVDGPPRGFAAAWTAPTADALRVLAILLR